MTEGERRAAAHRSLTIELASQVVRAEAREIAAEVMVKSRELRAKKAEMQVRPPQRPPHPTRPPTPMSHHCRPHTDLRRALAPILARPP